MNMVRHHLESHVEAICERHLYPLLVHMSLWHLSTPYEREGAFGLAGAWVRQKGSNNPVTRDFMKILTSATIATYL